MADIDGDGRLDLICSSVATTASLPRRPGSSSAVAIPPDFTNNNYHRFTHGLGVGDVNNNGHLDLLEKDGWWENPGQASTDFWVFHPFQFSPSGGAQMFAVDLAGEGRNEIVTSLQAHGYGVVYYQAINPAATDFRSFEIMTDDPATSPVGLAISQLHAMAIADINGDGVPDIVTGKRWWAHANKDPGHEQPATLLWLETQRGGGGVRFQAHVIDNSSGVGTDITVGDINGDGLIDILSGTKRGAHLFLQRPAGLDWGQYLVPGLAARDPFGQRPAMGSLPTQGGSVPALQGRPLNFDLRSERLIDWEARGPAGRQALRDGWIDTGSSQPNLVGELISRPFQLQANQLSVELAGQPSEEAFIEVISERTGKRLAAITAGGTQTAARHELDLTAWRGELVRIRIVDHAESGYLRCRNFLLH